MIKGSSRLQLNILRAKYRPLSLFSGMQNAAINKIKTGAVIKLSSPAFRPTESASACQNYTSPRPSHENNKAREERRRRKKPRKTASSRVRATMRWELIYFSLSLCVVPKDEILART